MATRASDLVIDSFAWVEYFRGGRIGGEVDSFLTNHDCATPTIVLAELSDKYAREHIAGLSQDLDEIEARSALVPLDRGIAEDAGRVKTDARKRVADFPLADGIIYATAHVLHADVLTGDPHLRGWRGVVFLR